MKVCAFAERAAKEFTERSRAVLGNDLAGVYLHGSAAMGCFNPAKSDLDLIVVIDRAMDDMARLAYMDTVTRLHNTLRREGAAHSGIEMSVVLRGVCDPFVYPTPFELHFSAAHLSRYLKDPEAYIREMRGKDRDLAAHFTVIRERGVCLYGLPVEEVFGEVPRADYLDSILRDVASAPEEISADPVYYILNLARVLAFVREGLVLSKKEGGEWGLENLPPRYRPLILSALAEYASDAEAPHDPGLAADYARYMLGRLREESGSSA